MMGSTIETITEALIIGCPINGLLRSWIMKIFLFCLQVIVSKVALYFKWLLICSS